MKTWLAERRVEKDGCGYKYEGMQRRWVRRNAKEMRRGVGGWQEVYMHRRKTWLAGRT